MPSAFTMSGAPAVAGVRTRCGSPQRCPSRRWGQDVDELAKQPESVVRGELAARPRADVVDSALKPIPAHVAAECRELAEALRGLFAGLRISVRRYAVRRHHDPGTVSRYLNGTAVAPADFIDRLLADTAEALRRPVSVEVTDRVTSLQRSALKATNKLGFELQVLKDQLSDADRRLQSAETNVEALAEALLEKKRRIAEMDAEKQRQTTSISTQQGADRAELDCLRAAHGRLLDERDRLQMEISRLQLALEQARRQAIEAERRCEALEHHMLAAEESLAAEAERGSAAPGRFTVSYAGPDRPWAVWIRHRLETIGHDAAVQCWDPPAELAPARGSAVPPGGRWHAHTPHQRGIPSGRRAHRGRLDPGPARHECHGSDRPSCRVHPHRPRIPQARRHAAEYGSAGPRCRRRRAPHPEQAHSGSSSQRGQNRRQRSSVSRGIAPSLGERAAAQPSFHRQERSARTTPPLARRSAFRSCDVRFGGHAGHREDTDRRRVRPPVRCPVRRGVVGTRRNKGHVPQGPRGPRPGSRRGP